MDIMGIPAEYLEWLYRLPYYSNRKCSGCPKYSSLSVCASYSKCNCFGDDVDFLPSNPRPPRYQERCYSCEHCLYINYACYCELGLWPQPMEPITVKNGQSATMKKMRNCPTFTWRNSLTSWILHIYNGASGGADRGYFTAFDSPTAYSPLNKGGENEIIDPRQTQWYWSPTMSDRGTRKIIRYTIWGNFPTGGAVTTCFASGMGSKGSGQRGDKTHKGITIQYEVYWVDRTLMSKYRDSSTPIGRFRTISSGDDI